MRKTGSSPSLLFPKNERNARRKEPSEEWWLFRIYVDACVLYFLLNLIVIPVGVLSADQITKEAGEEEMEQGSFQHWLRIDRERNDDGNIS